jgi:hypothetical protein
MTEEEKILRLLNMLKVADSGKPDSRSEVLSAKDWSPLLDCALEQDVAPMLYFHLKQNGDEKQIPERILQRLQQAYHQNAARNLHLYHELHAILERLAGTGLPVIVLKGAFLASSVYTNPALRSMADIDILMHPEDIPMAVDKLKDLGYHPAVPPWANAMDYHLVLEAPGSFALLEIHWGLVIPNQHYNLPVETIWKNALSTEIAGIQVLALAPEELLLHLCEHVALKHLFKQGVRPLVDIDRTIRFYQSSLNWEKITQASKVWGLQNAVWLALRICRYYLDTPLPEFVYGSLQFAKIGPVIIQNALTQLYAVSTAKDEMPLGWFRAMGEEKLIEKVKILYKYFFLIPKLPYQSSRKHSLFLTAYYVIKRLLYYIKQYYTSFWQWILHGQSGVGKSDQESILLHWLQS